MCKWMCKWSKPRIEPQFCSLVSFMFWKLCPEKFFVNPVLGPTRMVALLTLRGFVFHQQRVDPKYPLDNNGNFLLFEAVEAFQYPHRLRQRNNTHEPRALLRQTLFDKYSGFVRLHWIILRKVAN